MSLEHSISGDPSNGLYTVSSWVTSLHTFLPNIQSIPPIFSYIKSGSPLPLSFRSYLFHPPLSQNLFYSIEIDWVKYQRFSNKKIFGKQIFFIFTISRCFRKPKHRFKLLLRFCDFPLAPRIIKVPFYLLFSAPAYQSKLDQLSMIINIFKLHMHQKLYTNGPKIF